MSDDDELRTKLRASAGPVQYSDLAAHLRRQAVFVVDGIELIECGAAIATDDRAAIERWLDGGQLRRPSPAELEAWPSAAERRWLALVVQPFVLVAAIDPDTTS